MPAHCEPSLLKNTYETHYKCTQKHKKTTWGKNTKSPEQYCRSYVFASLLIGVEVKRAPCAENEAKALYRLGQGGLQDNVSMSQLCQTRESKKKCKP